jgi:hypothetical protein
MVEIGDGAAEVMGVTIDAESTACRNGNDNHEGINFSTVLTALVSSNVPLEGA